MITTSRRNGRGLFSAIVHALRGRRRETVTAAVTINRPPHEVFMALQHLEQLSSFMGNAASVRASGPKRTVWAIEMPTAVQVQWELEVVEEQAYEKLVWHSTEKSQVPIDVTATLVNAPGRSATELRVMLEVSRSAVLPASLVKLFAKETLKADLRRLKQILETGEVVHSDASIHRGRHPAAPSGYMQGRQR
jgi:uncharacterized membrane protein